MLNRFRPERQQLGLHCPGLNPGRSFHQVTAFPRDQTLEKTGLFPKSNRMTHPPHSVKVETEVVERVQDLCEHFIRSIKMAQIRSGVTLAHAAAAIRVERTGI